jgi:hypothetical protein
MKKPARVCGFEEVSGGNYVSTAGKHGVHCDFAFSCSERVEDLEHQDGIFGVKDLKARTPEITPFRGLPDPICQVRAQTTL